MNKNTLGTVIIAVGLLMSMTVVASSAFTTVTLDRDANIDVVADENGIIALQDHPDSEVVNGTSTGALEIDFDHANKGVGVNVNSTYTVGDTANPASTYAFNITNQNTATLNLTVDYALTGSAPGSSVTFRFYDSGGAEVGSVSDSSASATALSLNEGETVYVVIEVTGGADTTDDLSGTLTISA